MVTDRSKATGLREHLQSGTPLLGTFVKMPTSQAIEILGGAGFDFVVIDAEHAPLGRAEIDLMILAAKAANVLPIVRVSDTGQILTALDCGAAGVMVPHVSSLAEAQEVAAACRYRGGKRGYAGLTRASGWQSPIPADHMEQQDDQTICIAMIEDQAAVEIVDQIAQVDGIDALFVGRGDLTATFGRDSDAGGKVAALSERVAQAAKTARKSLLMLASSPSDAALVRSWGVSALLVSSDHGLLKKAASDAVQAHIANDVSSAPGR